MASMQELAKLHVIFNEIRGVDPDLPASHGAALVFLAINRKANVSPRVSDITAGLGMMPSSVSRMLSSLEGRGLISRSKDRADARTIRVQITNAGLELLERMLGNLPAKANVGDWAPQIVPLPAKGFRMKIDNSREDHLKRLERLETEISTLRDELKNPDKKSGE